MNVKFILSEYTLKPLFATDISDLVLFLETCLNTKSMFS